MCSEEDKERRCIISIYSYVPSTRPRLSKLPSGHRADAVAWFAVSARPTSGNCDMGFLFGHKSSTSYTTQASFDIKFDSPANVVCMCSYVQAVARMSVSCGLE